MTTVSTVDRPTAADFLARHKPSGMFTNEISPNKTVQFLRQVVYLGLTYRLGAR